MLFTEFIEYNHCFGFMLLSDYITSKYECIYLSIYFSCIFVVLFVYMKKKAKDRFPSKELRERLGIDNITKHNTT